MASSNRQSLGEGGGLGHTTGLVAVQGDDPAGLPRQPQVQGQPRRRQAAPEPGSPTSMRGASAVPAWCG